MTAIFTERVRPGDGEKAPAGLPSGARRGIVPVRIRGRHADRGRRPRREGGLSAALFAFRLALLALLSFAAMHVPANAQDADASSAGAARQQVLKVGVYVSRPFVVRETKGYSGMAIDLWKRLAGELGRETQYTEYETFRDLVEATAGGTVDVAITNLTITEERARRIDFTYPWFDAGLRVMINEDQTAGFGEILGGLQASGHLTAYAWIAGAIVLATLILTLFDRRFDKSFPQSWREGVSESFFTVMSIATSGKSPSRKNLFGWVGRIWQGLWLVCGVAVLAYVTSSVTSVMTTLSLASQISSVADLSKRPVGVFTGSAAEQYALRTGLDARRFPHIEDAVGSLRAGGIAGIVGDAPVLEHYAHTNPAARVRIVGPIFEPDKYGFGLPLNSPLTRQLTVVLLGAHERGDIAEIRKKYFGSDP